MHALAYTQPVLALCPGGHLCPNAKSTYKEEKTVGDFSYSLSQHQSTCFLLFKLHQWIFLEHSPCIEPLFQVSDCIEFRMRGSREKKVVDSLTVNSYFEYQSSSSSLLSLFITQSLQIAVACLLSRLYICIQWVTEGEFLTAEFLGLKYTLLPQWIFIQIMGFFLQQLNVCSTSLIFNIFSSCFFFWQTVF